MKKKFKLEELDCANCAAKMEDGIRKIEGVKEVSISFMTQKLVIEAEENVMEEVLERAQRLITKIEPECKIVR